MPCATDPVAPVGSATSNELRVAQSSAHAPSGGDSAWRQDVTAILRDGKTMTDVRSRLLAMAQRSPDKIAEFSRALLGDDDLAAREAAHALGRTGSPDAFVALVGLYHAVPEGPLRREVLDAIAGITNLQSADLLTEVLTVSDDAQIARMSQIALAGMMDANLLKGTVERYGTSASPDEQQAILGVIQQIRNPALTRDLLDLARTRATGDCAEPLARSIVDALGAMGTAGATVELLSHIQRNATAGVDSDVIRRALARTVNPDALPLLMTAARDTSLASETRSAAMTALGNYRTAEAGLVVRGGFADADPLVREAARRATARLQGLEE